MECESCGYENSPGSKVCVNCGAKMGRQRRPSPVLFFCIVAAVLVLVVLAFILVPKLMDGQGGSKLPAPSYTTAPSYATAPSPAPVTPAYQNASAPTVPVVAPPAPVQLNAEQYVGNVSLYPEIYISSAVASSEAETYDGSTYYNAENVFDGDMTTSWQEGISGYGEGESLTLGFNGENDVAYISFVMGSNTLPGYFDENGKPKSLLFEFSDGSSFSYDFPLTQSRYNLKLSRPVTTSYISMTILSTYPGSAHEDTAITEITVYGP